MFANLKNKIREETGSDIAKLAPILSSPPSTQTKGLGSSSNRHSNYGSTSSLSSFTEADGAKEDTLSDGKGSCSSGRVAVGGRGRSEEDWARALERRDAEWRRKLEDQEMEHTAKLEEKESEWRRSIDLLTSEKAVLEEEKRDVVRQKLALEEALKEAKEYKKKAMQYQEDMDQLEGFQTQEMAKIKHLLLVKEQELEEKSQQLKESESRAESLRIDLRNHAQQLNNLQEELKKHLSKTEEDLERERSDRGAVERALEVERARAEELSRRLQGEVGRRESLELRVAAVGQEGELATRRERERREEVEEEARRVEEVLRLAQAELETRRTDAEVKARQIHELEARVKDQSHHPSIFELEAQLAEKNKSIRVLQQRLGDMKKTLQRELRNTSGPVEGNTILAAAPENEVVVLGGGAPYPTAPTLDGGTEGGKTMGKEGSGKSPRPQSHPRSPQSSSSNLEEDVNFQYLKHVVVKFLTSREYEAQQLTRAVSTLLRLNQEEERLLRETLQWRASWFGSAGWRLGLGRASPSGTTHHSPT